MGQVNPNTAGSSTRSTRMSAVWPPVHLIRAGPPGRRSIVASLPNQAPSPSAVVSAAHTLAGGWATSTVRSMRSGKPMTPSQQVATERLLYYGNRSVASMVLPERSLTLAENSAPAQIDRHPAATRPPGGNRPGGRVPESPRHPQGGESAEPEDVTGRSVRRL